MKERKKKKNKEKKRETSSTWFIWCTAGAYYILRGYHK